MSAAEAHPARPALAFPERQWTYGELREHAVMIAKGLIGGGLRQGEHVGVLQPNGIHCLATLYGISLAGGVTVPINSRFRKHELQYIVEHADVSWLITSSEVDDYVNYSELVYETFEGVLEGRAGPDAGGRLANIVVLGATGALKSPLIGQPELERLADGVSDEEFNLRRASVKIRDTALILYTSGTTSRPSGCVITNEALTRAWQELSILWGYRSDDVMYCPLPMFHISGIGSATVTGLSQITWQSDVYFDIESAIDQLTAEPPTIMFLAFPTVITNLLSHPRYKEVDRSRVRLVYANGQIRFLEWVQSEFPESKLVTIYGSSEVVGPGTISRAWDPMEVRLTCGRSLPGREFTVVDPDTRLRLGSGESGEIALRGPTIFDYYYKDPEKTGHSFDDSGWFYTMDRGRMDDGGNLTFEGRIKDMLKVGGENVAPAEVEEFIGSHPAVKLAQIVGRADEKLEEVPVAFVELLEGATASAEEIIEYCRGSIASFKIPREVRFVEEWPMSATKIQKFRLREQLTEELGG